MGQENTQENPRSFSIHFANIFGKNRLFPKKLNFSRKKFLFIRQNFCRSDDLFYLLVINYHLQFFCPQFFNFTLFRPFLLPNSLNFVILSQKALKYMYFLAKREKTQEKPKVFEETLEKPKALRKNPRTQDSIEKNPDLGRKPKKWQRCQQRRRSAHVTGVTTFCKYYHKALNRN